MIRRDLSIDAFLHNFKKPFLLLVLHRHPVGFVPMASYSTLFVQGEELPLGYFKKLVV